MEVGMGWCGSAREGKRRQEMRSPGTPHRPPLVTPPPANQQLKRRLLIPSTHFRSGSIPPNPPIARPNWVMGTIRPFPLAPRDSTGLVGAKRTSVISYHTSAAARCSLLTLDTSLLTQDSQDRTRQTRHAPPSRPYRSRDRCSASDAMASLIVWCWGGGRSLRDGAWRLTPSVQAVDRNTQVG